MDCSIDGCGGGDDLIVRESEGLGRTLSLLCTKVLPEQGIATGDPMICGSGEGELLRLKRD